MILLSIFTVPATKIGSLAFHDTSGSDSLLVAVAAATLLFFWWTLLGAQI
jgi:hypothetical protein